MSGKVQPTEDEIKRETEKFHSRETSEIKESEYVHDVYNEIALHFSQTRYKPWPIVAEFLNTQRDGAFGVDIGCGNGKYLAVNKKLFILGSDYSTGLVDQAKLLHHTEECNDIIVADGMNLPHKGDTFDFAISIAVIHHFADEARRVDAISEILRVLKPSGQALIYCWALEQEKSRRGYHEGMEQDILVPWVLAKKGKREKKEVEKEKEQEKEEETTEEEKPPVKMRFYHLYKKGELTDNCVKAGGKLIREGYERDNWWAVVEKVE